MNAEKIRNDALEDAANIAEKYDGAMGVFASIRALKSISISKEAWPFKTAGNFQDMCKQEQSAEAIKLAKVIELFTDYERLMDERNDQSGMMKYAELHDYIAAMQDEQGVKP